MIKKLLPPNTPPHFLLLASILLLPIAVIFMDNRKAVCMKFKHLIFSSLFIFVSFSLSAQSLVGIKGGLNLTNFNGAYPTFDPRLGMHTGFFIQEVLSGKSHIRLEFQYSQKGARQDVKSSSKLNEEDRLLINYNYVEMPVIFKYSLFQKLSPFIGMQPGFLIKRFIHLKGSSTDYSFDSGESKGKIGAMGGIEYMLTKKLGVDVRYDRGLFGKGNKSHAVQLGISLVLSK